MKWLPLIQRYQGLAGLLILLIVAFFIAPSSEGHNIFFTSGNVENILNQLAVPGILAVGMTFVIVSGGIDLSVGSALGLMNCVTAKWIAHGASTPATCAYVLALGTLIGAIQGAIISFTKLQPFVVTLAGLVSIRGIAYVYSDRANVSGLKDELAFLNHTVVGLPVAGWILIGVTLVGAIVLSKSVFGRRVYAIGGNPVASLYAGVPVDRVRVGAYALNGLCIGIAGILFTARTNNGQPSAGLGYELDAITAAVVGGTALVGGYGSVLGTFIGALFIVCLNVLLVLKGIDDKIAQGFKGVIILIAVYLQNLGRRN
jgi:ribose transport system permease protein